MFDEYIRGKINSLGINVIRTRKNGNLILQRTCTLKPDQLKSNLEEYQDNNHPQSTKNSIENPNICLPFDEFCDSYTVKVDDIHQQLNASKTNIESSKTMKLGCEINDKGCRMKKKPTHFQFSSSRTTNFLHQQDNPDNTSSPLTVKDNVLEGKRIKEEDCQTKKTHQSSDIEKITCRTRKITI